MNPSNYEYKIPPQNIEAEQSFLGAMLLSKEALVKGIELLSSDSFYKNAHKKIYEAIVELFEKNEPADIVTLTSYLRNKNLLDEIGGATYLSSLLDFVPSIANIEAYAKIVKDKTMLRKLIDTSSYILAESFKQEKEVDELLDIAERKIFSLSSQQISRDFIHIKELLANFPEEIHNLAERKNRLTGLSTGFIDFDNISSGLQDADLIIVAGRPSMGKTAFALQIAQYVGINSKLPVAIFSLEMSKEQVVRRMLCSEARVDAHRFRNGKLAHEDYPKLVLTLGKLSESSIFIDDTPAISPLELRAKARRLKAEYDLKLIIIDYLQLMESKTKLDNRQQEISDISRTLKGIAKELNLPIIAISQLNRAPETRSGNRPQLADLRESGALEQDGDLITFLFREEYYNKKPENEGKAELIIAKQRNGPIGTINLAFLKEYTRFESMSSRSLEEETTYF